MKKYEGKMAIKNAMECMNNFKWIANTKVPTELYKDEDQLKKDLKLDDDNTLSIRFNSLKFQEIEWMTNIIKLI